MSNATTLILQTDCPALKLLGRGKVRDIYDLDEHLLIVATDRISAFDVILPQGIPHKGRVLTRISAFWFRQMADLIPHHLISTELADFPASCRAYREQLEGRSMLVHKTRPLPIECVVRGYLAGSAWSEYQRTGMICGLTLPAGLVEAAALPEPVFTPATKAESGRHDENIPFDTVAKLVGREQAERLREYSLAIYRRAHRLAETRGIIIADTKMEFGLHHGRLMLIDELLTPDSSRFWPRDGYQPGGSQPSFDKQFVRDYLTTIKWNRQPPAPNLPEEVVSTTSAKYLEALARLTGERLEV
ncbi:MAG: phosphoribosylaminoimidazolesuccinocarboxamide synthase [candidate division KSB1 bacterium]|nr:phosphoribosylaminoimidazolesuccinocarboxamide synthase [candidate division KSB1 bacterium]MDZ7273722.1 phosphoribosylaminoimidazolesuccinocarboxamide synthase [candidate division KSB1 bacterium]MDZ7285878.1 phosphoribosylaminoimidazolesuccinocarboxamide synthase [candidate division KSB1 bacterium]MDZ7298910.1 phosphoribosylaminoimidazolesuccinocarboxamide synthase [candidate division KSB1 bacterium]MDZ7307896.1 phosphoribosylaminoimidazolesuccinocarboxamide synthase [candidate division KSB1